MAQKDERSGGTVFTGQSQRCQLSTMAITGLAITTADLIVWTIDSAEIGAVNASLTIYNHTASAATVRLTAFVGNDNDYIPSAAGRVSLTQLYSEADVAIPLALSIAAGATDHVILGYKNQPMYTCFRYWNFIIDTAASTATVSIFGNAH